MRKLTIPGAMVGLISLMITGCGGVATGSESGGGDGGSSSPSGTPSVVKIGAPYPLTGAWAQNGQDCLNGMQLAADMINQAGGIQALGGAKVEIVSADTGSTDPSQAQAVTARLITSDHVSALVGSYLSSLTLTSTTAAEQYKVPIITQSYVDTLTKRGYHYTFQLPPRASTLGNYAVSALAKVEGQLMGRPVKSVGIIGTNDASNVAQMNAVKKQAEASGLQVSVFSLYPVGVTDAAPIVNKISAAKPDLIFAGGDLPDLALVVKAMRQQGINTPVAGPSGGGWLAFGFPKTLGTYAQGLLSVSTWNDDLKIPGIQAEADAYKKKFNVPFEPQESGESFTAVYDIVEAISLAKNADPQKIAEALRNHVFDSGYAATMTPGKVEFGGDGLNQFSVPIVIQWQNAIPRTVYPESLATTSPIH